MSRELHHSIARHGLDWIVPEWPVPPTVRAVMTTRRGGVSHPPFATMNLGMRCGDDPESVRANRARLAEVLGCRPLWLHQVHGTAVVDAESLLPARAASSVADAESPLPARAASSVAVTEPPHEPIADAALSSSPAAAPAVLVADCLPVLLADREGRVVAAAHAGWRGLAAGVIEATVQRMRARLGTGAESNAIVAWLGPAIGPSAFEVGDEVRRIFVDRDPGSATCFAPGRPGKWYADLYALVRRRLASMRVTDVHCGGRCTVSEPSAFYSYRRDGRTGRMAALVWLAES